jgi:hypothetical protein
MGKLAWDKSFDHKAERSRFVTLFGYTSAPKQIAAAYPFAQIPKRCWTSFAHFAQASCQFIL